ncbi:MAG TPA: hypothetical protein VEZ88_07635 [Steroidobacteraceae bacterium]|nr:hypothetical protein [Steroidobacteraceae bacterium]
MQQEFSGRFEVVDAGAGSGGLSLERRARRDVSGIALLFADVASHDLPRQLDGVAVDAAASASGSFSVRSGVANYHVAARSLQIHESAQIYAHALPLARFPFSQRVLWTLLLWSARFSWGQSLIRRLRGN